VRLAVSVLAAAILHGIAIGVSASAFSSKSVLASAPSTVAVTIETEVVPPRPDAIADSRKTIATTPSRTAPAAEPIPRRESAAVLAREVPVGNSEPDKSAATESTPSATAAEAATSVAAPSFPTAVIPASTSSWPGAAPPSGPPASAARGTVTSAKPRYRSNPPPEYPIPSRRRREEGVVLLNVVVRPDGLPATISLNRSSGYPMLDRAALDTVARWTFEPARAAGVPVSSTAVIPIRFSLSEGQ
jgi:protein TonB